MPIRVDLRGGMPGNGGRRPAAAPSRRPGRRGGARRSDHQCPERADLQRLGHSAGHVSGISARQGVPVVHDILMTESATVPAEGATRTAVDSTATPDGTTGTASQPVTTGDAAIPVVSFGAWPSPITAADVARGRVRLSFPTVI